MTDHELCLAIAAQLDAEPPVDGLGTAPVAEGGRLICVYPSGMSREDAMIEAWVDLLEQHGWDEDAMIATLAAEAPGLTPVEAIRARLDREASHE